MLLLLFIACFTAVVSWAIGFVAYHFLRYHDVLDLPNSRSSHSKTTVRGGGVGFVSIIILAMTFLAFRHSEEMFNLIWFVIATILLAIISFIDDIYTIGARIRFTVQFVSSAIIVFSVLSGLYIGIDSIAYRIMVILLSLLWITGYTNSFNFMDGINGLAAGQAIISSFGMGLIGSLAYLAHHNHGFSLWSIETDYIIKCVPIIICFLVCGAVVGFFPHNFPIPKMFMGDVGSAPLGFILGSLVLWLGQETDWWIIVPLVLLHTNFILDTALTLTKRIIIGEAWWKPHREHFYQKLVRSGKGHGFITCTEMTIQVSVLVLLLRYIYAGYGERVVLAAIVVLVWLTFFSFCEWYYKTHKVLN